MALKEMRARTLASAALGMNPATVQVNVIGGGTPQTAVPVISGTKPGGKYLKVSAGWMGQHPGKVKIWFFFFKQ